MEDYPYPTLKPIRILTPDLKSKLATAHPLKMRLFGCCPLLLFHHHLTYNNKNYYHYCCCPYKNVAFLTRDGEFNIQIHQ